MFLFAPCSFVIVSRYTQSVSLELKIKTGQHSKVQCVILEVLGVYDGVMIELGVGDKLIVSKLQSYVCLSKIVIQL